MKGTNVMKEVQMKNFRSLKDTGEQKLSPITILVGENSSGKSTFLRAFPLLKQSISKRTSGPILWAGDIDDYVDFGSFEETVTNDESDSITFRFKFEMRLLPWFRGSIPIEPSTKTAASKVKFDKVDYQIVIRSNNGRDYVSEFILQVNEVKVRFDLSRNNITVDDSMQFSCKVEKNNTESDVRKIRNHSFFFVPDSDAFGFVFPDMAKFWEELMDEIKCNSDREPRMGIGLMEAVADIGRQLSYQQDRSVSVLSQSSEDKLAGAYVEAYNKLVCMINESQHDRLKNIIKLVYIYSVYPDIDVFVSNYFKNVHYIAPLRATAERYYRLRNLAVDEVDYQGKNLAIFINSLNGNRLRAFQAWTNEHFGFSVNTGISKGHLSLRIRLTNSEEEINLSDTGFGYSQVLPIITQLWDLSSRKQVRRGVYYQKKEQTPLVVAIEQPELHLHPAVQAKLAKAFIASVDLANKSGNELQLLLETHSETIINTLGNAIARGELEADDVSVILFEKKTGKSATSVRNSTFDEDGYLDNWPYGFFSAEE